MVFRFHFFCLIFYITFSCFFDFIFSLFIFDRKHFNPEIIKTLYNRVILRWFHPKLEAKPFGVLFYGPPGTGKTEITSLFEEFFHVTNPKGNLLIWEVVNFFLLLFHFFLIFLPFFNLVFNTFYYSFTATSIILSLSHFLLFSTSFFFQFSSYEGQKSANRFFRPHVGDTEKLMRDEVAICKTRRDQFFVMIIDEFDSLGSDRSSKTVRKKTQTKREQLS